MKKSEKKNNLFKTTELLKINLDKIGITLLLFLLTSFLFILFTHPEFFSYMWFLLLIPIYVISFFLYQRLVKHRTFLILCRWVVFVPLTLLVLLCFISQFAPDQPSLDFIITHNFVDLSQIHRFTKYRSCSGHQTVDQYSDEPISNMQHYINADPRIDPGQIKIYAPFDGYVLSDAPNTLADGITMIPRSGIPWWPFNQWRINFPHTHVLPAFQKSPIHEVKAGDHIGYVNSLGRYGQRNFGTQVRVGVIALPPIFKNGNGEPFKKLDSVFNYMSDEVFGEYQAAIPGLQRREDLIITREHRLAHPCKFKDGYINFDDRPPYFKTGPIEELPLVEQDVYIGIRIDDIKGMIKARMCDDPADIANNQECLN